MTDPYAFATLIAARPERAYSIFDLYDAIEGHMPSFPRLERSLSRDLPHVAQLTSCQPDTNAEFTQYVRDIMAFAELHCGGYVVVNLGETGPMEVMCETDQDAVLLKLRFG